MKQRNVLFSLVLVIALLFFAVFRRWQEPRQKEWLDRRPAQLAYTSYALCRMRCSGVDSGAVEQILEKGIILFNRSNRRARPCPVFSVQAGASGRSVRLLVEQCSGKTIVVNCYLQGAESNCACTDQR